MIESVSVETLCTADEAVKLINRQPVGASFYVRIEPRLVCKDNPAEYYSGLTSVKVSRATCIKTARDALSSVIEGKGGRISCLEYTSPRGESRPAYRAFYLFG